MPASDPPCSSAADPDGGTPSAGGEKPASQNALEGARRQQHHHHPGLVSAMPGLRGSPPHLPQHTGRRSAELLGPGVEVWLRRCSWGAPQQEQQQGHHHQPLPHLESAGRSVTGFLREVDVAGLSDGSGLTARNISQVVVNACVSSHGGASAEVQSLHAAAWGGSSPSGEGDDPDRWLALF